MYKIIGADHREYGPCSADELRRWYREGRVNAQTLVQAIGSTEWKPFSAHPELVALASGGQPGGALPPPPTIGPVTGSTGGQSVPIPADELLKRDYQLDILGCLRRAWALMQKNFWPIVGISFLVSVAEGAANQFAQGLFVHTDYQKMMSDMNSGGTPSEMIAQLFSLENSIHYTIAWLIVAPLKALLMGGLYAYYLKLIRGQSAQLSDAFSGFTVALGPLLLLGLIKALLETVGLAICVLPGIYLAVAWGFAVPLMMDRRMDAWAVMELSRKVVSRHWFTILGLVLVNGIVAALGILACCIGEFVTVPLAFISLMYAYEDIFNRHEQAAQVPEVGGAQLPAR